jgi:hypothetical protein
MCWEAVAWANRQRTNSCSAQSVLLQLANWATPEGVIRLVRAEIIASCTIQSRATVYRRLAYLEEIGLFERKQTEGRRRDGSAVISGKLHLDRIYFAPEIAPDEAATTESQIETEGGESQIETGASLTGETGVSLTGETPYKEIQPEKSQTERETPPPAFADPPPNLEEEEEKKSVEFEERLTRDFSAFRQAYPFDASMSQALAREEFGKLNAKERLKAIRFAGRYRLALAASNRSFPANPVNWLRRREFQALDETEKEAAASSGEPPKTVFVFFATPAWDAWEAHWQATKGKSPPHNWSREHRGEGWHFPTRYPPKAKVDEPSGA